MDKRQDRPGGSSPTGGAQRGVVKKSHARQRNVAGSAKGPRPQGPRGAWCLPVSTTSSGPAHCTAHSSSTLCAIIIQRLSRPPSAAEFRSLVARLLGGTQPDLPEQPSPLGPSAPLSCEMPIYVGFFPLAPHLVSSEHVISSPKVFGFWLSCMTVGS